MRGEGFVGFDQVEVIETPAGLVQTTTGSADRADAHDRRIDTGVGVAGDARQYRQAQGLGLLGAHQYHGGGAVVDGGGVASGDAAVLLEGGLELGQAFGGGAGARAFVGIEGDGVALPLRDQDGRDLILEAASLDGRDGFLLGGGSKGVLLFAGQAVLLHQILGGDAHVVVVEGVGQAVVDHGVQRLGVAHAHAGTGGREDVGRQAHVFLAAGDDHFGVAATDGLDAQVQGLEAGTAELVQVHGRYRVGQAGEDGGLAGRVLAGAGGEHLAENHFIDLLALEAGLLQQLADHCSAQFMGGNIGQRALEAANGSAGGGNDYDVFHEDLRLIRRSELARESIRSSRASSLLQKLKKPRRRSALRGGLLRRGRAIRTSFLPHRRGRSGGRRSSRQSRRCSHQARFRAG
ncbi:hypothetical protein D9M72_253720 [compost metagenome]